MAKSIKNKIDIDQTADLAFEELLELATMDLSTSIKQEPIKSNSESLIDEPVVIDKNDLSSIIKFAKQIKNKIKEDNAWIDPEQKAKEEIIIKAKQKGKSEYDSDVLRELILERQKNKRQGKINAPIESYLKNIKNNRE